MTRWMGSFLLVSLVANAALLWEHAHEPQTSGPTHSGDASSKLLSAAQARLAECEAGVESRVGSPDLQVADGALEHSPRARAPGSPQRGSTPSTSPVPTSSPRQDLFQPSQGEELRGDQDAFAVLGNLDENRLRQAGLHPGEIERLRSYIERLREEAEHVRNRPFDSSLSASELEQRKRERTNLVALLGQRAWPNLRREFGDDTYDTVRYAAQSVNRVEILELFAGSPAVAAGFERGDAVLSYDGERVFSSQELMNAVQRKRGPGSITVEVEREGRRISIYAPPGRLGALLTDQVRRPSR